jgi:hypothetical protein
MLMRRRRVRGARVGFKVRLGGVGQSHRGGFSEMLAGRNWAAYY